jgi:hypothetical protein
VLSSCGDAESPGDDRVASDESLESGERKREAETPCDVICSLIDVIKRWRCDITAEI